MDLVSPKAPRNPDSNDSKIIRIIQNRKVIQDFFSLNLISAWTDYSPPTIFCCCILDTNECDDDNGGCSQNCTNTEGSFECFCRNGYILDSDGKNCSGTKAIYAL